MEKIVELVLSGLAVIGGLIMADELRLTGRKLVGALLIFASFLIQTIWNNYDTLGLLGTILVFVIIIVRLLWPPLRRRFQQR